jgi:hypothetical protein
MFARVRSRAVETALLQVFFTSERTRANPNERPTLPFLPRRIRRSLTLPRVHSEGRTWTDIWDRLSPDRASTTLIGIGSRLRLPIAPYPRQATFDVRTSRIRGRFGPLHQLACSSGVARVPGTNRHLSAVGRTALWSSRANDRVFPAGSRVEPCVSGSTVGSSR